MTNLRDLKPGDSVALVNHHWDRRIAGKRTVAKVHKTGNFTLLDREGKPSAQQWRPNHDGSQAEHAGTRRWRNPEHLEPWSQEIEAELRAEVLARKLDHRRNAIVEHLKNIHRSKLRADVVEAIEAALGIDTGETIR